MRNCNCCGFKSVMDWSTFRARNSNSPCPSVKQQGEVWLAFVLIYLPYNICLIPCLSDRREWKLACSAGKNHTQTALPLSIELSFNISLDIAEASKKNSSSFRRQCKYVGLQGMGVFGESVGGEGTRPKLTQDKKFLIAGLSGSN